jgi:hypothetical protein
MKSPWLAALSGQFPCPLRTRLYARGIDGESGAASHNAHAKNGKRSNEQSTYTTIRERSEMLNRCPLTSVIAALAVGGLQGSSRR